MEAFEEFVAWVDARPHVNRGGTVDEHMVQLAEDRLGPFPVEYRHFLRTFGWLKLRGWPFYGVAPDVPQELDLVRVTLRARGFLPNPLPAHFLPVSDNGGGDFFCLDRRRVAETGTSPVLYWDHARRINPDDDVHEADFLSFLFSYVPLIERREAEMRVRLAEGGDRT